MAYERCIEKRRNCNSNFFSESHVSVFVHACELSDRSLAGAVDGHADGSAGLLQVAGQFLCLLILTCELSDRLLAGAVDGHADGSAGLFQVVGQDVTEADVFRGAVIGAVAIRRVQVYHVRLLTDRQGSKLGGTGLQGQGRGGRARRVLKVVGVIKPHTAVEARKALDNVR